MPLTEPDTTKIKLETYDTQHRAREFVREVEQDLRVAFKFRIRERIEMLVEDELDDFVAEVQADAQDVIDKTESAKVNELEEEVEELKETIASRGERLNELISAAKIVLDARKQDDSTLSLTAALNCFCNLNLDPPS